MSTQQLIQDPFAILMDKGYTQQLKVAVRREIMSYIKVCADIDITITDNDVDFLIEKKGDNPTSKDIIAFLQYKLLSANTA
uniref:Uncharacterized protein n=1 Tax=Moumouvirus sp. 'Monve' TaxID=1128131 RepID=H2EFN0_9VIRU|nr:hypothetical protein mv_L1093 [Moumouvirus Monve]